MSEAEKQVLKTFKSGLGLTSAEQEILVNYIDKLQKELNKKDKVIDLMAFEISENTGSCPADIYDWENKKYDNCNNCNDTYKECFIEYFYKEVEEEND